MEQDSERERSFTIKDIVNNLSRKYIKNNDFASMTPHALRNPITQEMLETSLNGMQIFFL